MKKLFTHTPVIGFLFTAVLGTLLHFAFDLLGGLPVVALFAPVNESIFEHMKLLFVPLFVFSLLEYLFAKEKQPCFWWRRLLSLSLATLIIPLLYYGYVGAFGRSVDAVNIAIYYLAAAFAFFIDQRLSKKEHCEKTGLLPLFILLLLYALFILFTFFPPTLPLFADPVTGSYGIAP